MANRTDAQGRRLCKATAKSGKPCRAPAVTGAMVCRSHGGAAPQVKAKAHELILRDLIGPALMVLREVLTDDDAPAAVRVRAASEVLSRVGYSHGQPRPSTEQVETWIDEVEAEHAALTIIDDAP